MRPRLLPPVYLLLSLISMAVLHRFLPGPQLADFPARWAGAVVSLASVNFVVWIAWIFHRADTTIKPFQESSALLQTGPYRFSRNPIYLGLVGVLLGVAIFFGSMTPWFVIPFFVAILHFRFVLVEEAMLGRTFGAAYADYRRQVRRWL
jgi:protein-S-isoprenylcysteine O-methyltransferase Ste14